MSLFADSFIWKLVVPVPLALAVAIMAGWYFIPRMTASNTVEAAIASAAETVGQFKTIRGYYTKNIVEKVKANGTIKLAIKHKGVPNTVPLPATFVHDVSKLLEKRDTKVRLYSAYPFPNRKARKLDDFQSAAWEALNASPDAIFSRRVMVDGKMLFAWPWPTRCRQKDVSTVTIAVPIRRSLIGISTMFAVCWKLKW